MLKKSHSVELVGSYDGVENRNNEATEGFRTLSSHNFSVKASMAVELRDLGLSKTAIGRILHVSIEDIEVMLKEYGQGKK
jgi:hypothetical protein